LRLRSPASAGLRETKERCKTLMEAKLECESFGIELGSDVSLATNDAGAAS